MAIKSLNIQALIPPRKLSIAYRIGSYRRLYSGLSKVNDSPDASPKLSVNPPPSIAPKRNINIRDIRENPELHAQNCLRRNYQRQSEHPATIIKLFAEWKAVQNEVRALRARIKYLEQIYAQWDSLTPNHEEGTPSERPENRDEALAEIRLKKEPLENFEIRAKSLEAEMESLANELPNMTSEQTPIGKDPLRLRSIGRDPTDDPSFNYNGRDHVAIGLELDLLDFRASSTTSGWGWYYLKNEAALLEQALVQFSLSVAMKYGFSVVTPPSIVYSHIAAACGFQPRDQGGEQQIYALQQSTQPSTQQSSTECKPELSLAGTAEIPFAALKANTELDKSELPLRIIGTSRCYRAEAGARGLGTKGLFRVHEFTKVEMFAWTAPGDENAPFDAMIQIQIEILESLDIPAQVLEQPSDDLGASARRKQDVEAFFPSRRHRNHGWGEVASISICSDYQTRRLATRMRSAKGEKLIYPSTVNGTAMAVPRVLAAILENHWNDVSRQVNIPPVLWPWMHGIKSIRRN